MIGFQTLMTVKSFTLVLVMVSQGLVAVQERLSLTMPQGFAMIRTLFQDGKDLKEISNHFNICSSLKVCLFAAKIFGKTKKRKNCKTIIMTTITHNMLPSSKLRVSSNTSRQVDLFYTRRDRKRPGTTRRCRRITRKDTNSYREGNRSFRE